MANLEQSRIRTPDAWSADISKIKEVLVLKGIFSGIKSVCVFTYLNFPPRLGLNDFNLTIFLVS